MANMNMEIAHNPIATSIIDEMFNFVFPKNYKPEKTGKKREKNGKKTSDQNKRRICDYTRRI